MTKKGGVQLLQADINTDDEFEKFLERPGLLVMDVYTEWCGPCLGMVGSLKKIKLELGGDNLQLAICKSDKIESLKRFRNKSEPTWLFASHGKSVNIMFGTNVPKLMKLITAELEIELAYRNNKAARTFYDITEPLPLEVEQMNLIRAAEEEAARIEKEAIQKKRRDYITYFTSEIALNLPDLGITIFGPHISREIFKKLIDPADSLNLSCKDRKVIQILPEHLEILHFDCPNPLDDDVLDYIFNKEILICIWKVADSETRPIEELLNEFVRLLTQVQPIIDEFGNPNPELSLPPIMQVMEMPKEIVLPKLSELLEKTKSVVGEENEDPLKNLLNNFEYENFEDIQNEDAAEEDSTKEETAPDEESESQPVEVELSETEEPAKLIIPAVWTPGNKTTNAAAIYLYYRQHTEHFLPPDPVPEPLHLAIAFDAYKRKDIVEVCEQYKSDILSYGYFTSSDPDSAQLIANSTKKYETKTPTVADKLVLKVAKTTSHALLALAANGPCYVSQNVVDGKSECLKFFPEGYKTGEVEEEEAARIINTVNKKKKKKKKKMDETSEGVGTVVSEADPDEGGELEGDEDPNGEDGGEEGKEDGEGEEET